MASVTKRFQEGESIANKRQRRVCFAQVGLDALKSRLGAAESVSDSVIKGVFIDMLIQRLFSVASCSSTCHRVPACLPHASHDALLRLPRRQVGS
jgi:hypothetical protein